MALPKPTFSLTIPSILDDTVLNCRIYHPKRFSNDSAVDEKAWSKKGAVLAHPYAPLGGDQDDPVVALAGLEILKAGFILGTFNFRGAGSSKGRTSWTAKSELSDYISFTGFFIHYLHYLDPIIDPPASRSPKPSDPILTPIYSSLPVHEWPSPTDQVKNSAIDLVLGGFSYGAMVTTLLPTTDCIMSKYEKVIKGTAAAEIQLRAKSMARTWNQDHAQHRDRRGRSLYSLDAPRRTSGSITIGGDEAEPGTRRPSRDSRRSVDSVGKSLDIRQSLNPRRQSDRGPKMDRAESRDEILQASDIPIPRTHYLLISPIPGPISMLLTFFSDSGDHQRPDACIQGRDKLRILPTLCVYGGSDMVAGQKRLRRWVERHKRENGSRFQFCEVPRAGHFWHEEGVSTELQAAIAQWIKQISGG